MTPVNLTRGQTVLLDGQEFEVSHRSPTGIHLIAPKTLDMRSLTDAELVALFAAGKVQLPRSIWKGASPGLRDLLERDFAGLSEHLQAEAKRRQAYVVAVHEQGVLAKTKRLIEPVIAQVATQMADEKPPSFRTLCRWLAAWDAGDRTDIRVLVPGEQRRGNRRRRLPAELQEIIDEAVGEIYMKPERPPVTEVKSKVDKLVKDLNGLRLTSEQLATPSLRTLYREIERLSPDVLLAARHGKRAAKLAFTPVARCPEAVRPLEVVEIDHTKLDLFVVDERSGVPLGRPTLTIAIDRYTRMVVGHYIGFEPPGCTALMACLRNAMLPKTYVADRFPEVKGEWPCFGVPESLVVDNGKEFHSASLREALRPLHIDISYAPVKQPHFKGKVERFFGTLTRDLIQSIPGTTFANILAKGEYDSEGKAILTLKDLREIFHHWIINIYSTSPHRGIGDIPLRRWEEGVNQTAPRLPPSLDDLDAFLGLVVTRTPQRYGIEYLGLKFNGQDLAHLRLKLGNIRALKVKIDPDDLSRIRAEDPITGKYVTVPSCDPEYTTNLTLAQHKLILGRAKERIEGAIDVNHLIDAKDELRQRLARALSAKKGQRNRAARFFGGASPHARVIHADAASRLNRLETASDCDKPEFRQSAPSPENGDDLSDLDRVTAGWSSRKN